MEPNFNTVTEPNGENHQSWKMMTEKLYHDLSDLYLKESQLIRAELSEKVSDVKSSAVMVSVGATLLLLGAMALVGTATALLWQVVPLWAAFAIVTTFLLVVGAIIIKSGTKKLTGDNLELKHSKEALLEMKTTIKEKIHEYKH